ncbi:ABC transporter ATP-binding protein [Actinomadura spongiicola]|uniref:ABC transporter ATP-binding protein n=1 Tax=Actinomadura spongiicola TaxID=2303421 RepID=A0A372GHB4_9ACTN|nr:ABC transporter ATP-binding protein [Actinomadura spongiicola]RFS84774.1 ABC transporter ATP-binding protein [Actinomadura spongiicola]
MSRGEEWGAWGVTVAHGRHLALDEVTLEVPAGQVAAVVGGDGAGKTTLLRCLTGAARPRSGRVAAPSRREIGYMPAATGVWRDLTVAENMEFVGSAHGIRGKEFQRRRDALLEPAGLAHVLGRRAGNLSGGMLHKLAFSAAMLHRPRLLLLDEPSTGIDPVSRIDLWRLISQTAVDGTAVALATTYLDEAERCATVLVLDAGRTLRSGTPDEVIAGVPGTITAVRTPPDPDLAWRRGRIFHAWHPGPPRPDEQPISPDMEDAVVAAAIHARHTADGNERGSR